MLESYPDILSVEELCDILSVGHNTIYALLRSGKLKALRCGRVWKIPKEALQEFIVRQTNLK